MTQTEKSVLRFIVDKVCDEFNVTQGEIMSRKRLQQDVSDARFTVMWLIRNHLHISLNGTGRMVGNRTHATVQNALNNVDFWLSLNNLRGASVARLDKEVERYIDTLKAVACEGE